MQRARGGHSELSAAKQKRCTLVAEMEHVSDAREGHIEMVMREALAWAEEAHVRFPKQVCPWWPVVVSDGQ